MHSSKEFIQNCPYDGCPVRQIRSELKAHKQTCGYRIRLDCHVECGTENLPMCEYLLHLTTVHKVPMFEEPKATLFVKKMGSAYFKDENTLKYQPLGILKLESTQFLVMAVESESQYWLYSILLADDTSTTATGAAAATIGNNARKEGGGQTPYLCSYLLALPPTTTVDTSEYNVLRNPSSSKFHDMIQNFVPSKFARDRVLSLKDSFDPEFDMDSVFQIEKLATGQFFLIGREKFELKVEIHQKKMNVGLFTLDQFGVSPESQEETMFSLPQFSDDVNEQSRRLIEAMDEIKGHQVAVRSILESEQPTPEDLKIQCHLSECLGDGVAAGEVVDQAALMSKYQGSMFS